MPRNVESLIERYIEEQNFESFILTFAIQSNIEVPDEILKKFGSSYGTDNIFYNIEHLDAKRNLLASFKIPEKGNTFFSENEILEKINAKYNRELETYNKYLRWHQEEISKLSFMREKVIPLKTSDKLQAQFKSRILKYVNAEIRKSEKYFSDNYTKPVKIEPEQFINQEYERLQKEYKELKRGVKCLQKKLLIDPAFCELIVKDWLIDNSSKNKDI